METGRRLISFVAGAAALLLGACSAQSTYNKVPATGHFVGEPRMVAIAPNTFFFFQPEHHQKFAFTTHAPLENTQEKKGGRGSYRRPSLTIEPEDMITTGANVPRRLWLVRGFGSFDFTRASIIHDWLFEAHHRYRIAEEGYRKAKADGNRVAMKEYEADLRTYWKYKDITQDDAADIFAECIKVTMNESKAIVDDFDSLSRSEFGKRNGSLAKSDLKALRAALLNNRPSPSALWAYHYFVSTDCLFPNSKRLWDDKDSNLELYELLSDADISRRVATKGYLSPWLLKKFHNIFQDAKDRRGRYVDQSSTPPPLTTSQASSPETRAETSRVMVQQPSEAPARAR